MKSGDPEHLYSLWNCDSPDDIRIISLSRSDVKITKTRQSEQNILCDFLNNDQYFLAKWRFVSKMY